MTSPGAQFNRGRAAGVFGTLDVPMGLGLLRLATEGRPDWSSSVALIHFAIECGVRLLDTGDTYGLDESDLHYGERLAGAAVQTSGCPDIQVVTKVGLGRRGKRWMPRGRPEQLRAAVEGSLAAMQTDCLPVALLHARDPQTPFEESLNALAEMQKDGWIRHLGLCNTSIREVQQAQRHFDVCCVQNELSVLHRKAAEEGLLEWTRQQGIPFLAHRPLAGHAKVHRIGKNKVLKPLAERRQATPHQVALAALWDAAPHVIPLIGATQPQSLVSSIGALGLELDVSDRTALAVSFPFQPESELAASMPLTSASYDGEPTLPPNQGPGEDDEVVLLMGIQGAGKSYLVREYLEAGYARLNRDELGGTLDGLGTHLESLLANGQRRVVLDNTYPTRTSRALIVSIAARRDVPVRCRFLDTPLVEAQKNIVLRMMSRYGVPLGPEEMKAFRKQDPNLPPPIALMRWMNSFEPPKMDEGFGVVDIIPFQRDVVPEHQGKGVLLDVDGTLRETLSGEYYPRHVDDQRLLPNRTETLRKWVEQGRQLFFVSNQSGVSSGRLDLPTMQACFLRTAQLLDLPVTEIAYCPHPAHPIGCFCRKPMPGLGVYLMQRHQLAVEHVIMVGDMDTDRQFAEHLGVEYYDQSEFFA